MKRMFCYLLTILSPLAFTWGCTGHKNLLGGIAEEKPFFPQTLAIPAEHLVPYRTGERGSVEGRCYIAFKDETSRFGVPPEKGYSGTLADLRRFERLPRDRVDHLDAARARRRGHGRDRDELLGA